MSWLAQWPWSSSAAVAAVAAVGEGGAGSSRAAASTSDASYSETQSRPSHSGMDAGGGLATRGRKGRAAEPAGGAGAKLPRQLPRRAGGCSGPPYPGKHQLLKNASTVGPVGHGGGGNSSSATGASNVAAERRDAGASTTTAGAWGERSTLRAPRATRPTAPRQTQTAKKRGGENRCMLLRPADSVRVRRTRGHSLSHQRGNFLADAAPRPLQGQAADRNAVGIFGAHHERTSIIHSDVTHSVELPRSCQRFCWTAGLGRSTNRPEERRPVYVRTVDG